MFCKISYTFDSQEDKNNVQQMLITLCKFYNNYVIIDVGRSIITIIYIENKEYLVFKKNFSDRTTVYKSKHYVNLQNKFTYEDVSQSPFSCFAIHRNYVVIENKNFDQLIQETVKIEEGRHENNEFIMNTNNTNNTPEIIQKKDVSTQTEESVETLDPNFTIIFNKLQRLKQQNLMKFLVIMDKLKNSL
jgi:hypothetical protein